MGSVRMVNPMCSGPDVGPGRGLVSLFMRHARDIDLRSATRTHPVSSDFRLISLKTSYIPPISRQNQKCAEIGASKVGFSAITGLNRQRFRNRRTRLRLHAFMKSSLMEAMTWRTIRTPTSNAVTALAGAVFSYRSSSSLLCLLDLRSLEAIRRRSTHPALVPHLNRRQLPSKASRHPCQPNNATHSTHDLTDGRFLAPVFLCFPSAYRSLPCCF